MPDDLITANLASIGTLFGAAGGLGTAAYGLVDASKAFCGGMSNPGFGFIRRAVGPLLGPQGAGAGAFGPVQILATLRANWLNGVAKPDQKAIAKSLIRLGLTPGNASQLATATGVDANELFTAARNIANGNPLTQQDINVLGRFDAVVSAILDLGYERADQLYRNSAKVVAAAVAIVLAVIGGGIIFFSGASQTPPSIEGYLSSKLFLLAIVIGAMSTPLAPVAKDLSSSLQAAVKAVSAARR
jgi:hypothetical protein